LRTKKKKTKELKYWVSGGVETRVKIVKDVFVACDWRDCEFSLRFIFGSNVSLPPYVLSLIT
jgi:hypothetical protein